MDLSDLLARSEGKTLEFKRDLSSPRGVLRSLVAFANTAGGILLVGVEDGTRSVRGVPEPLDLEERLANLISDAIAPRLVPDIEIVSWRGTQVVAVEVFPGSSRPYRLAQEGPESGVYVRVGSTNRRADPDLIEELRRYARGEAYDEQALPELGSEAVDFQTAAGAFADVRKLRPEDLETLRLVSTHQGRLVPTVGGLLLFGCDQDRGRLFPDAWIQAGRFRGLDKSQIVDHLEIRANLVRSVEEAVGFVRKHSLHGLDIGAIRRTDRWNLPPVAVREAVVNAVAHADYRRRGAPIRIAIFDDRLEVENPGLLQFGLTVEDIRRGVSKLRNRVIGRVFNSLGLIEQWGSGIQRMTAACREAGLPPPGLEEIGTRFRVTLWTQSVESPMLDVKDQAIIDAITADGASTGEIAAAIDLSTRATRTRLIRLIGRGLIREVGTGPRDPKRRYFRST
ncbi:helix-turn-helix domain-containing protein [Frankia sp. CiP3]|uniref:AlbA family DNA-binding domain-containing protein n=1 Tax=Frankia sp. CiP3 TaxID=2880971 RepID=UPI001EF7234C|nr:helix-turn-helix domain-containing protein [Frankia sp. CiP3]